MFDENDQLLGTVILEKDEIKVTSNGSSLKTYSTNLNKIPLVLLDLTERLEIY